MADRSPAFASVFGDEAQLAVDRAAAELRAGRPVIVEALEGAAIAASLDSASPAVFETFAKVDGGVLALSATRARTLGLAADGPVEIPLTGLTQDEVFRLAMAADVPRPERWVQANAAAVGTIELCKYALLLPAALLAPATDPANAPLNIHRIATGQIEAFLNRKRHSLEIVSEARVPLADNNVQAHFVIFRGGPALRDQVAILVGDPDPASPVLVRLHSACLTGDLFGSLRCDCGDQLRRAVAALVAEGGGALLYLDQEGRGIGICNKMRAYTLQDDGFDTIDADAVLGFDADERHYELAASMLSTLGYRRIRLMTNNPDKIDALLRAGIEVTARRPLVGAVTAENLSYLSTKARRAGHLLEGILDLPQRATGGGE